MLQNKLIKLLIFTLLFIIALPIAAAKKDKKVKDKRQEGLLEYGIIQPDPIPSRPRPDHYTKPLDAPSLFNRAIGGGVSGFDISHYQGRIDWDRLITDKNAGYMYIKATEGSGLQDNMYQSYMMDAKRVGFLVGSYHFFRGTCTAEEQLSNFLDVVDKSSQDLLPLIDVEVVGKVSRTTFHQRLQRFLILVEKAFGKKPLIYTGQNFYNTHMTDPFYRDYKFMIACYTDDEPTLTDDRDFLIWQYTGHGSAQGVRGHIDISRFVRGHTLKEIMY